MRSFMMIFFDIRSSYLVYRSDTGDIALVFSLTYGHLVHSDLKHVVHTYFTVLPKVSIDLQEPYNYYVRACSFDSNHSEL